MGGGGGTQTLVRHTEHKPKLMFPTVQNERVREGLEATCLGASPTNAALLEEYGKNCFLAGEILSGKYLQNFTILAQRLERPTKELKVFLSTHEKKEKEKTSHVSGLPGASVLL